MDQKEWKEKRFESMDAALTEIEAEAAALEELNSIADALEGLADGMNPEWMGYILKTIGQRCREMAYLGESIGHLVNSGLTVPDPKEDVFEELAEMEPTGRQLAEMLTGKAGRTEK